MTTTTATDRDCREAVALAEDTLRATGAPVDEYMLVRAENVIVGTDRCPGPRCWTLVFKRRDLIPTEMPAELTAGGEVFVEVDLAAKKAEVTGYGE